MAQTISRRELMAGGLFVAFGAYFAIEALSYDLGTAFRMGPGFMPLLLGCVLAVLGLGIAATGLRAKQADAPPPVVPWRGIVLTLGTIAFFGACIRGLGFIPVVAISAFAMAMASRRNNPLFSAMLAVGLCVMCVLIFVVGLGLIVPLVGPWLRF
jgi:hypothetical protein